MREPADLPLSEEEIKQLINDTAVPTDSVLFESSQKEDNFIAIYGKVPDKEGIESYDWWLKLQNICYRLKADPAFEAYFENNTITGYSASAKGYILIFINPEIKSQKSADNISAGDIQEIQQIIQNHAESEGIDDVPVLYSYSKNEAEGLDLYIDPPSENSRRFGECFKRFLSRILSVLSD
ncbi:MAG: hypothetical protein LBU81_00360 [Methanosarcinales archaeon]|nr:hypothetical protein [Methanosarcinales archaeon]